MRHRLSSPRGCVTPQLPGRTPYRSALRLPGGETLLFRRPKPGPRASRSALWRASGTTKRAAGLRASGTTSREGGNDVSGGHEAANGPVT